MAEHRERGPILLKCETEASRLPPVPAPAPKVGSELVRVLVDAAETGKMLSVQCTPFPISVSQ